MKIIDAILSRLLFLAVQIFTGCVLLHLYNPLADFTECEQLTGLLVQINAIYWLGECARQALKRREARRRPRGWVDPMRETKARGQAYDWAETQRQRSMARGKESERCTDEPTRRRASGGSFGMVGDGGDLAAGVPQSAADFYGRWSNDSTDYARLAAGKYPTPWGELFKELGALSPKLTIGHWTAWCSTDPGTAQTKAVRVLHG